ncbi:MAG TPA: sigma-54 dependent transcriptional regulator [Gemmatimonadaceae bacterium]
MSHAARTDHYTERPPAAGRTLRALIVGADTTLATRVRQWLTDSGAQLDVAPDLPRALRALIAAPAQIVFAVIGDGADDVVSWTDALRGLPGRPRLVVLTARPSIGLVLQGERAGILDVIALPLQREAFDAALRRLGEADGEIVTLPAVQAHMVGDYALVGESPAMLEVYKIIARVAPSTATVLIEGESGTGKEVIARALHRHGPRSAEPFVAVNCAAIPENLLESELFGHEKGSFTGAVARKIGRFEQATGGTLFLDEIGDMSLPLQAKILRAVQEREVERIGGQVVPVDVRLIAATNHDLAAAITSGKFREDLYYRLAVVSLHLPSLRERGDDLLRLATHFIKEFSRQHGRVITGITRAALDALCAHAWVGNVRELRNAIERASLVADGETLRLSDLPHGLHGSRPAPAARSDAPPTLAELEARHIAQVLASTGGRVATAAKILGVHRNTLTRKMREYGL